MTEVDPQDIEDKKKREASVWYKEVRNDGMGSPAGAFNARDSDMKETDFLSIHFNNVAVIVSKNPALASGSTEGAAFKGRVK